MNSTKNRYNLNLILGEDGFTLLEAVVASLITAGTLVIVMLMSMRSFNAMNDISSINDINLGLRRVQREFTRDVQMAQYFFFGADEDNTGAQIANEYIDRRVLTVGYENLDGEMIWTRLDVQVGIETSKFYLVRTTNEISGGIDYQTTIVATDVSDVYFTYFDVNGLETTKADQIRRIEMAIVLEEGGITDKKYFSATLRGDNLGIALPNKNLEVYQESNLNK